MKKIVNAIIPARAGSKGIKNKNLSTVEGIPLYERSIQHAIQLRKYFKVKIWVSTDIDEILNKINDFDDVNFILRRKELSGDKVLTIDVVKDLIKSKNLPGDEIALLLQPTSPFRDIDELNFAINFLVNEQKWNSIVSLSEVEGHHPFRMKRLVNDNCIDFIDQGFEDMRPRQNLPKVYIRSGNFYISFINKLLESNSLLPKPTKGICHSDSNNGINIDNKYDLYLANIISENKI